MITIFRNTNTKKEVSLQGVPLQVSPLQKVALHSLQQISEFEKRGVQVLGCSIDSQFTHVAWRNTAIDDGGFTASRVSCL